MHMIYEWNVRVEEEEHVAAEVEEELIAAEVMKELVAAEVMEELVAAEVMKELHIQKWPIHRRSSCFLFQIEF